MTSHKKWAILPRLTWRILPVAFICAVLGCQSASPAAPTTLPAPPSASVGPSPVGSSSAAVPVAAPSPSVVAKAGSLPTLQVAYPEITENRLPLWLGVADGSFPREGVQVQDTFIASTPTSFASLISGDTNVLEANGGDLISAISKGADVKIIGVVELTTPYRLWAQPNIQTPQDLVGKSIGVSKLGSASYVFVSKMLQALGLAGQVTIVPTGDLNSTRAAFQANAIQGYADTPVNVSTLDPSTIHQLGDPGQLGVVAAGHFMTVRSDYLQSHRDELVNFLEGYVVASADAYNNESLAKQVLGSHLQNQAPQFLQATYAEFAQSPEIDGGMPLDPTPTTQLMQQQIDLQALVDTSFDPASLNASSLIDPTLMEAVKASPLWSQLWPSGPPGALTGSNG